MRKVVVAPAARREIAAILEWSDSEFGPAAMERYRTLIGAAIQDLTDDPFRRGTVDRFEIAPGCRTYHLSNSRTRATKLRTNVKRPRHFVLFRFPDEDTLEIVRVLHDSMDLEERIFRERLN